jgi:sortase B
METTGYRTGKMALWLANSVVNFLTLALVLLLVAFSLYALWDSDQVYQSADSAQYEIYKPSVEDEGESFGELVAINPEVFSWLTIYGTHVDYPVTQAEDNWKYVNTNAKGDYSMAGAIFLDAANLPDFSDFNSIFYGHHMEKSTMFGELGLFSGEDYFNERPYGNLYYEGEDHGIEFFSFLHVDAYDTSVFAAAVQGEDMQQAYLDNILAKSMYKRDIGVTIQDRIVLLTTCSSESTNGRDILVGRITNSLYEDGFITEEIINTGTGVDAQDGGYPMWIWWLAGGLLALILLILVLLAIRKKKQKQR